MLKRIIRYTDLDTCFRQTTDKENYTHLELTMPCYIDPVQCASDIEKILEHFAAQNTVNLEINFSSLPNDYVNALLIALAFANRLKQGIYPKRLGRVVN